MSKETGPIDAYIGKCTEEEQQRLNTIRQIIRAAAPDCTELISWAMPTFKLHGQNLIHFAMHKAHIGLYPGVTAIEHFQEKLADFKHSKGAIQFPMKKSLPVELITEIVAYQVALLSK